MSMKTITKSIKLVVMLFILFTQTLNALPPNDTIPSNISIKSPSTNQTLNFKTPIIGTIDDKNLLNYKIFISPSNENNFRLLKKSNHPVINNIDTECLLHVRYK